jgi:hypothetical protein
VVEVIQQDQQDLVARGRAESKDQQLVHTIRAEGQRRRNLPGGRSLSPALISCLQKMHQRSERCFCRGHVQGLHLCARLDTFVSASPPNPPSIVCSRISSSSSGLTQRMGLTGSTILNKFRSFSRPPPMFLGEDTRPEPVFLREGSARPKSFHVYGGILFPGLSANAGPPAKQSIDCHQHCRHRHGFAPAGFCKHAE